MTWRGSCPNTLSYFYPPKRVITLALLHPFTLVVRTLGYHQATSRDQDILVILLREQVEKTRASGAERRRLLVGAQHNAAEAAAALAGMSN